MSKTREQQQAIAIAAAKKRKADAERLQASGPSGAVPFFNKALAGIAGAPVDITNSILGAVGVPVSDEPIGGSRSLERGLAAIGAPTPQREPATTGEYIGQVGGEVAGFLAPMARFAQMAQRGSGITARLGRAFTEEMVNRPGMSLAMEAGGATGAGIARQATAEGDLGPGEQMLAETIGGIGGAGISGSLARMAQLAPSALTGKAIAKMVFPFTEQGAFERASARVQSLVSDPERAAGMIEDLKGSALLPSARTAEPGLMALEKVVLSRDPAEAQRISVKSAEAVQELANSVRKSGSVRDTRKFIKAKYDRLVQSMDARVELAANDAAKALSVLDPNMTPADASVIVRESIEQALADAKVQEAALWQAIPQDAVVPTQKTIQALERLESTLPSAQRGDMPDIARNVINNFGNEDTVAELDGLYKKLGEIGRIARSKGEANQARITDELRDAILEDMADAKGGPEVKESLDLARKFSLEMNKKFRRGNIGKILGYAREGGVSTPERLTLESTVGKRGQKGQIAAQEIATATGDDPLALEGIQNYIKARFVRDVISGGQYSPAKAKAFMRQYEELLGMFPALKDQLETARGADDVFRRVKSNIDAKRKRLDRKDVSAAALFLGAPVDRTMDSVMLANDPPETMRKLVALARDDQPALNGLKAGFSEWLVNRATSEGRPDILGRQNIYGLKLQAELAKPTVQETMKRLYSPDELKQIERSVKELALFDRQSRIKGQGEIISDRPSRIIEIVGRVLGAKIGASFSSGAGASIQAAQLGSREAKNILQRLTADRAQQILIDAIEDPDLMRALLTNQTSKDKRQVYRSQRVLRSYFASRGARLLDEDSEEEKERR